MQQQEDSSQAQPTEVPVRIRRNSQAEADQDAWRNCEGEQPTPTMSPPGEPLRRRIELQATETLNSVPVFPERFRPGICFQMNRLNPAVDDQAKPTGSQLSPELEVFSVPEGFVETAYAFEDLTS